ncbi:MAG TPA: cohesin domain-containing protein [Candidatus Paceibacterota bacterium]|nr:cohesin domain-containing protein [Candidatus Paceibacterota bacterium]
MKKLTFAFGLLLAFSAYTAQAATITLSPTTISVAKGQTVTLTVAVDAQGSTLGTVSSNISYPSALLTPTSFTFAPNWMQLTKAGYDQMSAGTVIKTAGYPGGFAGTKTLGTITFTAVGTGAALVQVQNNSLAYSTSNQNTLSGTQGSATVTITGVAVSGGVAGSTGGSNPGTSNGSTLNGSTGSNTASTGVTATATGTATGTEAIGSSTQAAAVGALGFSIPTWITILLILVIVAGGVWFYMRSQKAQQ